MKKIVFPVVALLFSVFALAAFNASGLEAKQKFSGVYWIFTGDPNNPSDIADASKYMLAPGGQATCSSGSDLCNIFAQPQSGDPNHPDLSTEVTGLRTFKN